MGIDLFLVQEGGGLLAPVFPGGPEAGGGKAALVAGSFASYSGKGVKFSPRPITSELLSVIIIGRVF